MKKNIICTLAFLLFFALNILSCKSQSINKDVMDLFLKTENIIPKNDTVILRSDYKFNFGNRLLDGVDVEEIQTNQKYFGENYYQNDYEKINIQYLKKIIEQTKSKILWSEPYSNLYYYNNSIKTELSNIDNKKEIDNKPFVYIVQNNKQKDKTLISIILSDWRRKIRHITEYTFIKEKFWKLKSIEKKEVTISE